MGYDCILAGSNGRFDFQVLLDLFEEQLYLPARIADIGNGSGSKFEIVGQKEVLLACIDIPVTDTAKLNQAISLLPRCL